jgi:aromatic-L-amino-acid decarboxylase
MHLRYIRIGRQFAAWVDADQISSGWPVPQHCVSASPEASAHQRAQECQALLDAVNDTGEVFLSHTRLRGLFALRLQVSQLRTEERHVRRAWELIRQNAGRIASQRPVG